MEKKLNGLTLLAGLVIGVALSFFPLGARIGLCIILPVGMCVDYYMTSHKKK